MELEQRIESYIIKHGDGEHWVWTGFYSNNAIPYPIIKEKSKGIIKIRNWLFEQEIGDIPEYMDIKENCTCFNCVNPAHLKLISTHCYKGHLLSKKNKWKIFNPKSGCHEYICRECNK